MKKCLMAMIVVLATCGMSFAADITGASFRFLDGMTVLGGDNTLALDVGETKPVTLQVMLPAGTGSVVTGYKVMIAWDTAETPKDGNLSATYINLAEGFTVGSSNQVRNAMTTTGPLTYGNYYNGNLLGGTYADFGGEWITLGILNVTNVNMTGTMSHDVKLFDRPGAASGYDTTVVAGSNTYSQVPGQEAMFTVVAVPEPISMILHAIGGLFISRRK